MKSEVYWIVLASLAIPAGLAVLLRRTPVYWLPSGLQLVGAAAAYVFGVLCVFAPELIFEGAASENGLRKGLSIVFTFFIGGMFAAWATLLAWCGVALALITARWRVCQGLPTRFGSVAGFARRRDQGDPLQR